MIYLQKFTSPGSGKFTSPGSVYTSVNLGIKSFLWPDIQNSDGFGRSWDWKLRINATSPNVTFRPQRFPMFYLIIILLKLFDIKLLYNVLFFNLLFSNTNLRFDFFVHFCQYIFGNHILHKLVKFPSICIMWKIQE